MNATERTAKTPSAKTGRFAVPFSLLRGDGSGAPSSGGVGGRTPSLRIAALTVVVIAAFLALAATPAFALETRVVTETFGEAGSGSDQLELQAPDFSTEPPRVAGSGLAINQTSHDVYVADTGNGRVAEFEADGTFVRNFGSLTEPTFIAIDNSAGASAGDVYVGDSATGTVSKFEADGTPVAAWGTSGVLSGFTEIVGIAVGPGGDLFVLDENQVLHRYEQDGTPVGSPISAPRGSFPAGLAADTEANLYKVAGAGDVTKFTPTGETLSNSLDTRPDGLGLGVDPANNDLYVIQAGEGTPFVNRFEVNCGESCPSLESFGADELRAPSGLAVDATSHRVYITDAATSQVDVFEAATVPDVTATGVSENLGTSATVAGEVNPAGIALTECAFEYVTQAVFEQSGFFDLSSGGSVACEAPDAAEIPVDEEFHPVHAELQGLTLNTAYRFRLKAANAQGANRSQSLPLTTLGPPAIDATSASEVSATAATLEAELNPHGLPTTYHFEYDTVEYTEGGGPHGESTPTAYAGSGTADVLRTALIGGLQPATTYHFRVVAENELGVSEGPDRSFTTQPATASTLLPDGRGYELVSPPDKHGVPLQWIGGAGATGSLIQAAADGDGLTYAAVGSIAAAAAGNRSNQNSQLLSLRSSSGAWSTADITTPNRAEVGLPAGHPSEYKLFSTDLSLAALEPFGATPLSPQATEPTPYRREADGTYAPLVTEANVPSGTKFGGEEVGPELFAHGVAFTTATPGLTHLLLRSPKVLTPGFDPSYQPTYASPNNAYEWSAGTLILVSQIPLGAATACGGPGPACIPASEAGRSSEIGNNDFQVRGAISTDGSRVIFKASNGPSGSPALFLRDLATEETLALDAAQPGCSGCESGGGTIYQDASADGSRVFFTDTNKLTEGSGAAENKPDLYECRIEIDGENHLACALTDLTPKSGAESAAVQDDVIGASEDGSSLYFVANGALAAGAVHGDCVVAPGTVSGECNLYRYDSASESLRLVTVLSAADFPSWVGHGEESGNLSRLTARVSPNGRFLAFMSERPLTGYDNRDAASGERDEEVFLYDAAAPPSEALRCASCNPTGARPHGFLESPNPPFPLVDGQFNWAGRWLAANLPGWTGIDLEHALYQSRYLSDSGRLFFNAADALAPADTNGTQDVYQFEPSGVGGCTASSPGFDPRTGGCLGLISSGTSPEESAFLDASEPPGEPQKGGDNVFFLTASKLVPRDVDGAYDVYDARVGGGEPQLVKPVECSGDACQQPAVPPNDQTPGSLTFNGAGNLLQCPKGKVKKSGKCVKKKAKKHKKSHNKHKRHKRTAGHNRGDGK